MRQWLDAAFLIAIGAGMLAVAWRGHCSGELPAGANGLRGSYRPGRARDPLALRLFVLLYLCCGMALLVWGLLVLVGMAPALRLR